MKVTGMNSASLAGALYEYTSADNTKNKDSGSLENLLSSGMAANNMALAALAQKSKSASGYQKTLTAAEQTDELLEKLTDAKRSVFVKAKDAADETEKTAYELSAATEIANALSSYNTLLTNLSETGGKANKAFLNDLDALVRANEKDLAAIGIACQQDGTLALDAEAMAAVDIDAMADVFGPDGSFAKGLQEKVGEISARTAATVDVLQIYSASYSNSGSYSQYDYIKGLYDLKA